MDGGRVQFQRAPGQFPTPTRRQTEAADRGPPRSTFFDRCSPVAAGGDGDAADPGGGAAGTGAKPAALVGGPILEGFRITGAEHAVAAADLLARAASEAGGLL